MNSLAEELRNEPRHTFDSLVKVMELLRAPGGCPWDCEQTHESIRSNFIEETYEVIEAIDTKDVALLREELGDVLMQVVFHAQISKEAGDFTMDDVAHEVTEKLIRRHPHVFGDVLAETSDEVLANWEDIKKEEKHRVGLTGSLESIPPSLPALMRAQKLQKKAAKAGFLPDGSRLASAIEETGAALSRAVLAEDREQVAVLCGRLSFLTAAAAQRNGGDTEENLSAECARFTAYFREKEGEIGDFDALSAENRAILAQIAYFLS